MLDVAQARRNGQTALPVEDQFGGAPAAVVVSLSRVVNSRTAASASMRRSGCGRRMASLPAGKCCVMKAVVASPAANAGCRSIATRKLRLVVSPRATRILERRDQPAARLLAGRAVGDHLRQHGDRRTA